MFLLLGIYVCGVQCVESGKIEKGQLKITTRQVGCSRHPCVFHCVCIGAYIPYFCSFARKRGTYRSERSAAARCRMYEMMLQGIFHFLFDSLRDFCDAITQRLEVGCAPQPQITITPNHWCCPRASNTTRIFGKISTPTTRFIFDSGHNNTEFRASR